MDIFFILNQLRLVFNLFISYLSNSFHKLIAFFDEKLEETKEVKKTDTDLFIEKRQNMFLKTFTDTNKDLLQWNLNINYIFYAKSQYQEMIKDTKNPLEQQWKTRILFENTPRGSVIMYYDPFKLGFSYYSDNAMPYNILNAIAMKYVINFRCRDFFIDEQVLPENTPLPILKLLQEDKPTNDKPENSEKPKEDENIKQRLRNAPFAKFKNYNKISNKVQENQNKGEKKDEKDTTEKKEPEKPKERNRFISLGKTHNFKILQSIPKKKAMAAFKSTLANSLFDNSSVQKEVFNYRDFKKLVTASSN
jgi:hypothetical protein